MPSNLLDSKLDKLRYVTDIGIFKIDNDDIKSNPKFLNE